MTRPLVPLFWLGVDPGGAATGLCLLNARGEYDSHAVFQRDKAELEAMDDAADLDARWPRFCVDAASDFVGARLYGSAATALEDSFEMFRDGIAAVEDVVAPNPHKRRRDGNSIINPAALLDTAKVFGAFCDFPAGGLTVVRPGGHGSNPYATYPDELVTDAERRAKGWRLNPAGQSSAIRHARSAYDVARAAYTTHRLRQEAAR